MLESMDIWVAMVGFLSAVAVAALTQIPGLTTDDRRRASIAKDVELWKALPEGAARDGLREQVEAAAHDLVASRSRDRTVGEVVRLFLISGFLGVTAVGLFVWWTTISWDLEWGPLVRWVLGLVIVGALTVAAALLLSGWVVLLRFVFSRRRQATERV